MAFVSYSLQQAIRRFMVSGFLSEARKCGMREDGTARLTEHSLLREAKKIMILEGKQIL